MIEQSGFVFLNYALMGVGDTVERDRMGGEISRIVCSRNYIIHY
jgi:hypothetical protein